MVEAFCRLIAYAIACRTATFLRSGLVRLMNMDTFATGGNQ